ncbi:FMO5 monooxygenase, partial [Cochlearius cochlearius]|nr:FMO5 monooxygenase [Cochlearius cochlearius]
MAARRVAIIGAGASGLCALKCCLDEGLVPTCFERSGDIGGLWRFEEHPEEGRASIYRSVIINTSKEMMCFSDFPIPEDFPNYMHNSKIMEYFRMYAQHFDLLRHIRLRTSVCRVAKRPDFAATGQWEVVTESQGKQEVAVFDAVLVCTGHHTEAYLPLSTFPGLEKFAGWYLHSRDYKSPQSFLGKRVVVVGTGNSGIDIAVELSHIAKQVFLSTRRGTWLLHRVADGGYPFDFSYLSRFIQLVRSLLPHNASSLFLERKLNARFDHALYGLQPQHRILDQHPTINDDLPNRIIAGMVLLACQVGVKPNLLTLFLTDPKLALEVAFGPCTPYQYRLRGPGKWAGAREAILTQRQRMVRPLQTRAGDRPPRYSAVPHVFKVSFSIGLIVATLVYVLISP